MKLKKIICSSVLISLFSLVVVFGGFCQEESRDGIYRKLDLFGEALASIQEK